MSEASPAAGQAKEARIAARRARYEALRAAGQAPGQFEARIAAAPRPPGILPEACVQLRVPVAPGWYWYGRVSAGACLRLANPRGTPGVSCLLWSAADPAERFCATDTVKVQWTSRLGMGRLLLSDMGRVLASIVGDTCGRHDALLGAGPPRRQDDSGSPLTSRNGAENLALAAGKLGLGPRDLHAPITFFAPVACDGEQRLYWEHGVSLAGTHVDLHAEMDLLVAASNTPHPLAPAEAAAQEFDITLWRPERTGISDFCRAATGEAQRAFAQTDAYLAERGRG